MTRGLGWTADQKATLVRMCQQNADWKDIAAAVGRTVASCKNKLSHPSRFTDRPSGLVRDVVRPRWTAATKAELIRLRDVEKLNWVDIDTHFGRMHGACSHMYNRLMGGVARDGDGPPAELKLPAAIKPAWTEDDMKLAETCWREWFVDVWGLGAPRHERALIFARIGAEVNRSAGAVEERLRHYGASFGLRPASTPLSQPIVISQAMIDARELHAARLRQNPCAALLGDPPPGHSELDKRRQACTGAPPDRQ